MMLWIGFIVAVGLFGQSFGGRSSYGGGSGQSYQSYGNSPSKGGYSQNGNGVSEEEINALVKNTETLEERQSSNHRRTNTFSDTSNDNLRFKFDFQDIFQKEIAEEQYQHKSRLDELAQAIADIQKLRNQANEAWNKYLALGNITDRVEAGDSNVRDTIDDLQEDDVSDQEEINEAQSRLESIEQPLNTASESVSINIHTIYALELILKSIFAETNTNKALTSETNLDLDKNGSAYSTVGFPGFPSETAAFLSGNKIKLRNYGYGDDSSAIGFNIVASSAPNEVSIDVVDNSSDGDLAVTVKNVSVVLLAYNVAEGISASGAVLQQSVYSYTSGY